MKGDSLSWPWPFGDVRLDRALHHFFVLDGVFFFACYRYMLLNRIRKYINIISKKKKKTHHMPKVKFSLSVPLLRDPIVYLTSNQPLLQGHATLLNWTSAFIYIYIYIFFFFFFFLPQYETKEHCNEVCMVTRWYVVLLFNLFTAAFTIYSIHYSTKYRQGLKWVRYS